MGTAGRSDSRIGLLSWFSVARFGNNAARGFYRQPRPLQRGDAILLETFHRNLDADWDIRRKGGDEFMQGEFASAGNHPFADRFEQLLLRPHAQGTVTELAATNQPRVGGTCGGVLSRCLPQASGRAGAIQRGSVYAIGRGRIRLLARMD